MELGEKAEEILEAVWIGTQENKEKAVPLSDLAEGKRPLEQLLKAGLVSVSDDGVTLTEAGLPEARSVVRRHRLAERLLSDVLGTRESLMHEKACKFEHLLDRGLDENICILLGHPRICPHGKPIPPGRCCEEEEMEPQKVVSPLSQLAPGHKGKVAYIYAPETAKLRKLMAMGILPGAPLRLIQNFPSFVFEAGETQFAVDREIADAIYVRLIEEETPITAGETLPARRRRGRKGRRFGLWWRRGRQSN